MVELDGLIPLHDDTSKAGMIAIAETGTPVVLMENDDCRPYYVGLDKYLLKKVTPAAFNSAFLRNLYHPKEEFSLSHMVGIRTKKVGERWEVFTFNNDRCKIIFGDGERRLVGGTHGTSLQWSAMFAMVSELEEYIRRNYE